ncbi:MAG: histidinol dehydrogenase [Nitrospirae bacterium]|nr:MAG: histidinol dehydrogenase [Nitrospirota bacterium]
MRIIRTGNELDGFLKILRRRAVGISDEIVRKVEEIINDVRKRGDRALRQYTERFDRLKLKELRLKNSIINRLSKKTPEDVKEAIELAAKRIRRYHEHQKEQSWSYSERGVTLGQIITPLERVGVYVPGGKASYPSTVLMNVIPAQVAGVREIALCVPMPEGELNPAVATAIKVLGIKEVYPVGGAQAIAALAYGTQSIRRVDKIVGPGNIYVALAKRMVFGLVDIDMIAGPSEILIIADSRTDPELIAADMLSQAEHDEYASSIAITTSEAHAKRIEEALELLLADLKRSDIARSSLKNFGAIIVVKNIKQATRVANTIAPEHLEVLIERPESIVGELRNAGAVFLGKWTPEPIGDYIAGPNHTLPTGGTARFFSPLGVYDFQKRTSLIGCSKASFKRLSEPVITLAEAEGLEAHANTIRVRLRKQ